MLGHFIAILLWRGRFLLSSVDPWRCCTVRLPYFWIPLEAPQVPGLPLLVCWVDCRERLRELCSGIAVCFVSTVAWWLCQIQGPVTGLIWLASCYLPHSRSLSCCFPKLLTSSGYPSPWLPWWLWVMTPNWENLILNTSDAIFPTF